MNKLRISRSTLVSNRTLLAFVLVVLSASTLAFGRTPQGAFDRTLQVNGPRP